MTSQILQIRDVTKVYKPNVKALENVSFSIQEGEFVYLMGRSGAGKTTLFRLITKQEDPDSGEILLETLKISQVSKKRGYRIRRRIGIVFQDFNLIEYKNVFQNISFALEIAGFSKSYINKQVRLVLEIVDLLNREKSMPMTLSGGEQQRVAIARAIVTKPRLLLADEPTGNLDFQTSKEIISLFSKINEMGTSILMATHDLDVVT
ncbi:MAG: ATP-binding cassette domain-containing protein, partial [Caldisericia bacterium]|nr:ATP-binding cassette domain-containing protein [Caldisericia bacterium]